MRLDRDLGVSLLKDMLRIRRCEDKCAGTLAADHRIIDGHRGGQFLVGLGELLQMPEALQ